MRRAKSSAPATAERVRKLEDADIAFHESEYQRLRADLQAAHEDLQIAGVTERRHARSVG